MVYEIVLATLMGLHGLTHHGYHMEGHWRNDNRVISWVELGKLLHLFKG